MSIGSSPFQGGGGSSSIADATETTAGKIRIATSTEAETGTNDTTAMTPLTVKERIDAAIVGGVEYKGTFNANTGLTNSGGNLNNAEKGDLYIIDTLGTIYGQTWAVGDHLLINDDMGGSITNSKIDKVDNTDDDASETVKGIIQIATSAEAATGTNDLKAMTPLTVKERIDALSLGTASTQDVGTSASNVVQLDGSARLPAVDGSQLTNLPSASDASETTKGIIEIATSAEATTGTDDLKAMTPLTVKERIDALSLGTASTQDVGTSASNVVQLDGSARLPAVDGSQLTNLPSASDASETTKGIIEIATSAEATTGTDDLKAMTPLTVKERIDALSSTYQPLDSGLTSIANLTTAADKMIYADGADSYATTDFTAFARSFLDDANATTARSTLSLGTASTEDVGTSASNVVQLDGSARLPAVDGSQLTNLPTASAASETTAGIIEIATSAEATTGTDDLKAMTPLTVKERIDALSSTYQPLDAGLTSIAALTTAANKMLFTDGSDSYDTTDLTAFARSLLDDANATTARTTLGAIAELSEDSSPQLGGDLDLNSNDIVTTGNADLGLAPAGTGFVEVKGNTNPGAIRLNCESNSHGVQLQSPPHSATATYQLILPTGVGTAGQVLSTDGGDGTSDPTAQLSWASVSGGSKPNVTSATPNANYTITTYTGIEEIYLLTPSTDIDVTLPAASSAGSGYKFNVKNLSTNVITLKGATGDNIDTITPAIGVPISTQYESLTVVTDGSNWFII